MESRANTLRRRMFLLALFFFLGLFQPIQAWGQDVGKFLEDSEAVLLWVVPNLKLVFNEPPADATDEVRGYSEVLPDEMVGKAGAVGVIFNGLLIALMEEQTDFTVNEYADVLQTPSDTTDDVFVESGRRKMTSLAVVFPPVHLFLNVALIVGVSKGDGEMEFNQISAGGSLEQKILKIRNTGLLFGLPIIFPLSDSSFFALSYLASIPVFDTNFSGKQSGAAIFFFTEM